MGPRDDVDVGIADRRGRVARGRGHLDRVGEERRPGRDARELLGELAVDEVQRAMPDEPAGGGVPERGRTPVAEHDLVAVGECEQVAQTVADPPNEVLDRCLAVRRSHQIVPSSQSSQCLGTHLGRSAAETPVGGLEMGRYLQCRIDHGHYESSPLGHAQVATGTSPDAPPCP